MNIGIITGASSGMGKEFVKLTMQNHLDLDEIWVIARRKERLEAWPSLYKEQKFRILPLDCLLYTSAAPGGKSTALAAKLQGEGFLLSNDISSSRCKPLLKNMVIHR